jgi:hypothetical protein
MPKIIISYRRDDSQAIAGRIRDKLASHYGAESVFMDIDSIPYGLDFRVPIQDALRDTDILVAVIGPEWTGRRMFWWTRIREKNDPVRVEVEKALERGIPVVPLLIGGASMPKASELPDSLKNLAYHNAAGVDAGRDFHQHMDRLIRSLDQILANPPKAKEADPVPEPRPVPSPPRRRGMIFVATAMVCAFLAGGMYLYLKPWSKPPQLSLDKSEKTEQPQVAAIDTTCKRDPAAALYDDFKPPKGGWEGTETGETFFFRDGRMVLKPEVNSPQRQLYLPLLIKAVTICSEIISPPDVKNPEGVAGGGIIFWATDYQNYYLALIYTNESYGIWRRVPGKWISVVPRTKSDSIRLGPNAINQLKVTTGTNAATLTINGTKIIDFRGQMPNRGWMTGLYGQSEEAAPNEWRFSSIAVIKDSPEKTPSAQTLFPPKDTALLNSCKENAPTGFFDEFRPPDLGWGQSGESAFFKDDQMVLKNGVWLYLPMVFKTGVVCSDIKSPPQVTKPDGNAYGGVIFWALDYDNYYVAGLYADGTYDVYRKIDRGWRRILPRAKADAIRMGVNAVNRMKIAFNNISHLATLFINDTKVVEFEGQPPLAGGSVGLIGLPEADSNNEWHFLNIAVMEDNSAPSFKPLSPAAKTVASACGSASSVGFVDDFTSPSPSWGDSTATHFFKDNKMVIKSSVNNWINLPNVFDYATICSEIISPPEVKDPEGLSAAGIIFWASNDQNYYLAQIFVNGSYGIWRRVPGKWITLVPRTKADSIRKGPNAINQLKVTTAGNRGTLSINDNKIVSFWGQSPRKGGAIGLNAQSENDAENEWKFSNIAVLEDKESQSSDPPAAVTIAKACKVDSRLTFFDDFKSPDPGWSPTSETSFFKDGYLVLKAKAKAHSYEISKYPPQIFKTGTVCADVRFPSKPEQGAGSAGAGIIFWAIDDKNLYLLRLLPDGTYDIYRKIDGEWGPVITRRKDNIVHEGQDAVNQIKVVLDSETVTIFINGTKLIDFPGQAPEAGGTFGVYGDSLEAEENEWRFTNFALFD